MAELRPFRGLRFSDVAGLDQLVAPPYDVMSDAEVGRRKNQSPHNIAWLTRPGTEYIKAASYLVDWIMSGVLIEDEPSIYVHEVKFGERTRRDLIAALRLEPYDKKVVLPHERTHRGPKEDRLQLMEKTHACLEPLWFLYDGKDIAAGLDSIAKTQALAVFDFGPEQHRLWRVSDAALLDGFADKQLLIADGHHRYETALTYAGLAGGEAAKFTMALLTEMSDPGLEVLPTHRVLKGGVAVTGGRPAPSLADALAYLDGRLSAGHYRDHQFQVIDFESGKLPLIELHRQVIDNMLGRRTAEEAIVYTRDAEEAVRWVDEGVGSQAFFLAPPDLHAVLELARDGVTLPQKSTYFYPKPPSGMVLMSLAGDRAI